MSISLGSQYLFRKISKFFTYITWITEVEQIYASTFVKEKTIQCRRPSDYGSKRDLCFYFRKPAINSMPQVIRLRK